jgi:hypothetical protein
MKAMRTILAGVPSLLLLGCMEASVSPTAVEPPRSEQAAMAGPSDQLGTFTAVVDFSTLSLTPRGRNCRLVVDGMLVFSGTVEGTATGTTTALVFAPCSEVATTPPGTYRDIFTSELRFVGTVNGEAATADALYQGVTEVGGAIDAHLHFANGVAGVLDVNAIVAVGGSYEGRLVVP